MPAPTALLRTPDDLARDIAQDDHDQNTVANVDTADDALLDSATLPQIPHDIPDNAVDMQVDSESRPQFAAEIPIAQVHKSETRKILIPQHRIAPLKTAWPKIYPPLVQHLKLQVRMLPHKRTIEMRTSRLTTDAGALQKGEDFVRAFCLGFDTDDAIALLRLDDLYIETFEVKDVKMLGGDHLSRAIGRIAGKDGKTKFAIENASKTRISLEGQTVHILGGFKNIHIAREAVVSLVLGSPPGKVYGNLRTVASRMKERF